MITDITIKRQADGTESRRFTAVTEANELCFVFIGRYKGPETNVRVGNYLLLKDVAAAVAPAHCVSRV